MAPVRGASAQTVRFPTFDKFVGQVATVSGPSANPSGFSLTVDKHSIDFKISPFATLVALSAEADVEGFVSGDYASVIARWQHGGWVARRIAFDVQPLNDNRPITFTADIVRIAPSGKTIIVRLPNGVQRRIVIVVQTRFVIDGQIQNMPPALSTGETIRITARATPRGWMAVEIDLKSGATLPG
jgi:hypothetical protein